MCFGGGGNEQYDAYANGDFEDWKELFDKRAAVQTALAKGELTQAQADAQLAAIGDLSKRENAIKRDPSANMEMREVSRQHDVGLGRIGIDKAFGNFNDSYYDGYKGDYGDYYLPQLAEQFDKANDKTTAAMADRGVLESSVSNNKFAGLARKDAEARVNIANEAQDSANKLRGTVENAKSSLYGLNEASANPQAINAQAVGQATALVAPPVYSPLGEVFASALNNLGSFAQAQRNRPSARYSSPYGTGYGSGSVIS